MRKRLMSIFMCRIMTAMLLAGCGGKESNEESTDTKDKGIKIGFAMKTQEGSYFVKLVENVEKQCEDLGWKCITLNADRDVEKEAENMESLISQGVDLIFLDCVESDSVVPSVKMAKDAGIPVIAVDNGVTEKAEVLTTVYSNNKQNGRMVGLAYAEKMKDQPINAIMLSGSKGDVAGYERRLGLFCGIIEGMAGVSEDEAWTQAKNIEDELIKNGKASNKEANFTIVGQAWGGWTEDGGLAASEDLITANKDVNCILGENDQMLFGAALALENAKLDGVDLVAAADGEQKAYDMIKDEKYFATGENSPVLIADLSMKIAKQYLKDGKKDFDKIIMTEAIAITKENVEERYDFGF